VTAGVTPRAIYEGCAARLSDRTQRRAISIAPGAIKRRTKCRANAPASLAMRQSNHRGSSFMGEACLRLSPWHYGETLTSDLPASCARARAGSRALARI